MTIKSIRKYSVNEVEEIFLLSIDEWKRARKIQTVPIYTGWWWLRSPGYYLYCVAYVRSDNTVNYYGFSGDRVYGAVRPAFKIPNLETEIGDKVFIQNTVCTVIDKGIVLSDTAICFHRFDEHTNDYEKSEVRVFLSSDKFAKLL